MQDDLSYFVLPRQHPWSGLVSSSLLHPSAFVVCVLYVCMYVCMLYACMYACMSRSLVVPLIVSHRIASYPVHRGPCYIADTVAGAPAGAGVVLSLAARVAVAAAAARAPVALGTGGAWDSVPVVGDAIAIVIDSVFVFVVVVPPSLGRDAVSVDTAVASARKERGRGCCGGGPITAADVNRSVSFWIMPRRSSCWSQMRRRTISSIPEAEEDSDNDNDNDDECLVLLLDAALCGRVLLVELLVEPFFFREGPPDGLGIFFGVAARMPVPLPLPFLLPQMRAGWPLLPLPGCTGAAITEEPKAELLRGAIVATPVSLSPLALTSTLTLMLAFPLLFPSRLMLLLMLLAVWLAHRWWSLEERLRSEWDTFSLAYSSETSYHSLVPGSNRTKLRHKPRRKRNEMKRNETYQDAERCNKKMQR